MTYRYYGFSQDLQIDKCSRFSYVCWSLIETRNYPFNPAFALCLIYIVKLSMFKKLKQVIIFKEDSFDNDFKDIYNEFRPGFLVYYSSRYSFLNMQDVEDLYNDTMIAFWDNVKSGKVAVLTSSLKSYIYKIGHNKAVDFIRKHHPEEIIQAETIEMFDRIDSIWDEGDESEREKQNAVIHVVNKLVEPCRTILNLFYFQQENMKSIARRMKYANADVAKSKKNQCMTKVRNVARDYMQTLGLI